MKDQFYLIVIFSLIFFVRSRICLKYDMYVIHLAHINSVSNIILDKGTTIDVRRLVGSVWSSLLMTLLFFVPKEMFFRFPDGMVEFDCLTQEAVWRLENHIGACRDSVKQSLEYCRKYNARKWWEIL